MKDTKHEVKTKQVIEGQVYLEVHIDSHGKKFWGVGCAQEEKRALELAIADARAKADADKANYGPPHYTHS